MEREGGACSLHLYNAFHTLLMALMHYQADHSNNYTKGRDDMHKVTLVYMVHVHIRHLITTTLFAFNNTPPSQINASYNTKIFLKEQVEKG